MARGGTMDDGNRYTINLEVSTPARKVSSSMKLDPPKQWLNVEGKLTPRGIGNGAQRFRLLLQQLWPTTGEIKNGYVVGVE